MSSFTRGLLALLICVYLLPLTAVGQWSVSYRAGTIDPSNNFMGGTEMRVLGKHKGKVFGGIETWMDDTTGTCDPFLGAQILRLDSPTGPWRLDKHFNTFFPQNTGRERKRNEGVTALESVIFRTDSNGNALATPDTLLIVACRDFTGVVSVYTRIDGPNPTWVETPLASVAVDTSGGNDNDGTIRSFTLHRDRVTGIDRVFAGALPNGIFSGTYDPSAPGKIRWRTTPELVGFVGRPMAFAVCNKKLYCAIAPNIWRREDGPNPSWVSVYSYPFTPTPGGSSGFRGLTAVKRPNGTGQSLLAALEGNNGVISRLDTTATLPYAPANEQNVMSALRTAFGYKASYVVIANSEMTWVKRPTGTDSVLIITVQHHPAIDRDDAFYFIRSTTAQGVASYSLSRINNLAFSPFLDLNSTRACVTSPFAGDPDGIYIGGFDADNVPQHNSAYVLRTDRTTFLTVNPTQTELAGLKQIKFKPSLTAANMADTFGIHIGYLNTAVTRKNKLLVFMPGSTSTPLAYENVDTVAANSGYHVLGLAYPNTRAVGAICTALTDSLCFDKVRKETITGQNLTTEANVNDTNCIENRILKALQYLHAQRPTDGWNQFYTGNTLNWSLFTLSGHSQGGGHAALMAKMHAVDKVLMYAAPKDYFTSLNRPAPWIRSTSATPACKYLGFVHQADALGCTPQQQLQIFGQLGMGITYVTVENNQPPFSNSQILVSTISGLSSSSAHNIVAVDVAAANICGEPAYARVWKALNAANPCTTTAIDPEAQLKAEVQLWPNPTSGVVQLKGSINSQQPILLTDNASRSWMLNLSQTSTDTFTLVLPTLPAGLYTLKGEMTTGSMFVSRVVVE